MTAAPDPERLSKDAPRWTISEPVQDKVMRDWSVWIGPEQEPSAPLEGARVYGPSPELCLERARAFVEAQQASSKSLTINDLAVALTGIQLALAWWREKRDASNFARISVARLKATNTRLSTILDRFRPAPNEEDEAPDNGEDIVRLTWTPSPPLASQEERP